MATKENLLLLKAELKKDLVNTKIKFREPYRPFAPSVLAERAEQNAYSTFARSEMDLLVMGEYLIEK